VTFVPASRPNSRSWRARASRIATAVLMAVFASPLAAAPSATCADYLAEAAQVSALPESLIAAVLHVESRGSSAAVSSAGAEGCMQIMPATWGSLTARYGLGADVYDPRANMIGGALYLREMVDRYGLPGGLAAYNAGPGRYEAWRDGRRNLPRETINYVAQIAPISGGKAAPPRVLPVAAVAPSWRQSSLFIAFDGAVSTPRNIPTLRSDNRDVRIAPTSPPTAAPAVDNPQFAPASTPKSGLFANIRGE
jgi:soluble lytic murein transglycosylase-like protein